MTHAGKGFIALILAWIIFIIASILGMWQLTIFAVMLPVLHLILYFRKDGAVSPINVAFFVMSVTTVITLLWLSFYVGEQLPLFSAEITVEPDYIYDLAAQQLMLASCFFVAFAFVGSLTTRTRYSGVTKTHRRGMFVPPRWLWMLAYIVGVASVFLLYQVNGSLYGMFNSLGDKSLRNSGNAGIVFLQYFGYAGALLWFLRNVSMRRLRRYAGLIALLVPMLATGDRGGVFATIVAAIAVDEQAGLRLRTRHVVLGGLSLAGVFVVYAMIRGGISRNDFFSTFFKDISMQYAYVVARSNNLLDTEFRPMTVFASFLPFIPSWFKSGLDVVTPNRYFTDAMFPGSVGFTASMGLFGEAHYIAPHFFSIVYYFAVALILVFIGKLRRYIPAVLTAILAGAAYRVARGGMVTGVTFAIEMALPVLALWLAWNVVRGIKGLGRVPYGLS